MRVTKAMLEETIKEQNAIISNLRRKNGILEWGIEEVKRLSAGTHIVIMSEALERISEAAAHVVGDMRAYNKGR